MTPGPVRDHWRSQTHLEDLQNRRYGAIARALDLDVEDVVERHLMILDLNPTPGRQYAGGEPEYVVPDVFVERVDGEWQVRLEKRGIPRLRVSRYFEEVVHQGSEEARDFVRDRLDRARALMASVEQREATILEVMSSIVVFQRDFFERGPGHLRPLILEDVAHDIGRAPSTVSRITRAKYASTPHGVVELRCFFQAGVRQRGGGGQGRRGHPGAHPRPGRGRGSGNAPERQQARGTPGRRGDPGQPAHRGQVPESAGHPALWSAEVDALARWGRSASRTSATLDAKSRCAQLRAAARKASV